MPRSFHVLEAVVFKILFASPHSTGLELGSMPSSVEWSGLALLPLDWSNSRTKRSNRNMEWHLPLALGNVKMVRHIHRI